MRVTGSGRKLSRVDQIVEKVALMLEAGAYKTFERLPSIRQAARENGVSKNTMAEAYDRLVARGDLVKVNGDFIGVALREIVKDFIPGG